MLPGTQALDWTPGASSAYASAKRMRDRVRVGCFEELSSIRSGLRAAYRCVLRG